MKKTPHTALPASDYLGNAGANGPGDREIRYAPYTEKQLLAREET